MAPSPPQGSDAVSVVIPAKDRADLLVQTLRSIAEQTAPVAEVIVADDGSRDDTAAVARSLGATVVSNPNGGWGASGARNAGLERVATDYVAFVDSDDLLLPEAVRLLTVALNEHARAPFAYGRALSAARLPAGWAPHGVIYPEPEELEHQLPALYARNMVPSSGALVRTAAARRIGGFDTGMEFLEDHDFWVRLAKDGDPVHVPNLVSVFRIHERNRHTPSIAGGHTAHIIGLAAGDPRLTPQVPEHLGVQLCELAVDALKGRRPDRALAAAWELLARRPRRVAIMRRVVRHFRARRAWYRQGRELWSARRELRDWLASY